MDIRQVSVPQNSLVAPLANAEAHYADCFVVPGVVAALPDLITAFYTQPLMRAERALLRVAARAPSTDADATALAEGQGQTFAVWTVSARTETEILLADASGRTLSWLSVADGVAFGSVVVPVKDRRGRLTLGPVFHSLLGAHKVYSRLLLAGAVRRLR